MSDYTCENCKKTYKKLDNKEWNDLKAAEEYLNLYSEGKNDWISILCDDCNEEFLKWFKSLSKEQKQQLRDEYYAIT
jgi:hypothetical protein